MDSKVTMYTTIFSDLILVESPANHHCSKHVDNLESLLENFHLLDLNFFTEISILTENAQ